MSARTVLMTGAQGFIARHLQQALVAEGVELLPYTREHTAQDLAQAVMRADWILHLAGVNRPPSPEDYMPGNLGLSAQLCERLRERQTRGQPPVQGLIYTSSTQAAQDNAYGHSKKAAEDVLRRMGETTGAPIWIYRLPNVFGPGSRPNYNSAVATFCHNISRGLPIHIHDPQAPLTLVYVEDVVQNMLQVMQQGQAERDAQGCVSVTPQHRTTVGQMAEWLTDFRHGRTPKTDNADQKALAQKLRSTYESMRPA